MSWGIHNFELTSLHVNKREMGKTQHVSLSDLEGTSSHWGFPNHPPHLDPTEIQAHCTLTARGEHESAVPKGNKGDGANLLYRVLGRSAPSSSYLQ